jgi:hydroxypyruvate isomerase
MQSEDRPTISRRSLFGKTLAATGGASLAGLAGSGADHHGGSKLKGNINHSVVFWCFNVAGEKWDLKTTCEVTKKLGGKSVELVDPKDWGTLKAAGLTCAIAPNGMEGAPFMRGFNNTDFHEELLKRTKANIDAAAEFGCPNVIAFNGYKWKDPEDSTSGEISLVKGLKNCVKGLKKLARHAEKKGVTVCLEMLNTRDDTHPMKGHPGYQGDDMDYCADIVKAVSSERVKLLFDIYHCSVMNGDVVRRLEQYKDIIGHVHTAGNPGRAELDDKNEIHYPAPMQKLVDMGYKGFVGHEFIPTRNPHEGLAEAITLCDV